VLKLVPLGYVPIRPGPIVFLFFPGKVFPGTSARYPFRLRLPFLGRHVWGVQIFSPGILAAEAFLRFGSRPRRDSLCAPLLILRLFFFPVARAYPNRCMIAEQQFLHPSLHLSTFFFSVPPSWPFLVRFFFVLEKTPASPEHATVFLTPACALLSFRVSRAPTLLALSTSMVRCYKAPVFQDVIPLDLLLNFLTSSGGPCFQSAIRSLSELTSGLARPRLRQRQLEKNGRYMSIPRCFDRA